LLIAHEAPLTGGFAAEIASTIQVISRAIFARILAIVVAWHDG